ncbi:MAG: hypothetical protein ACRDL9_10855 [Trebonia sp.]
MTWRWASWQASGTQLRLVVPACPSLEAAVAAGTPVPDTAAVTPAVVRSLEEMFGCQRAELSGRPVESLFLGWAQEPAARPAVTGARLAGVRRVTRRS